MTADDGARQGVVSLVRAGWIPPTTDPDAEVLLPCRFCLSSSPNLPGWEEGPDGRARSSAMPGLSVMPEWIRTGSWVCEVCDDVGYVRVRLSDVKLFIPCRSRKPKP